MSDDPKGVLLESLGSNDAKDPPDAVSADQRMLKHLKDQQQHADALRREQWETDRKVAEILRPHGSIDPKLVRAAELERASAAKQADLRVDPEMYFLDHPIRGPGAVPIDGFGSLLGPESFDDPLSFNDIAKVYGFWSKTCLPLSKLRAFKFGDPLNDDDWGLLVADRTTGRVRVSRKTTGYSASWHGAPWASCGFSFNLRLNVPHNPLFAYPTWIGTSGPMRHGMVRIRPSLSQTYLSRYLSVRGARARCRANLSFTVYGSHTSAEPGGNMIFQERRWLWDKELSSTADENLVHSRDSFQLSAASPWFWISSAGTYRAFVSLAVYTEGGYEPDGTFGYASGVIDTNLGPICVEQRLVG